MSDGPPRETEAVQNTLPEVSAPTEYPVDRLESGADAGPNTPSAGSSAAADRSLGPCYLPVRTLSKTSHQSETLEGHELK